MPLGNLTSQFFANVYLNELDYFIKHKLKAKYYLRYVDDFILIHHSKEQLIEWKENIGTFLQDALDLELHPDKSKIYPISHGIDFVGFRNFCHFRLLRKRNIKKIFRKLVRFEKCEFSYREMTEIFQGWQAYSKWGNTYKLRRKVAKEIQQIKKSSLKINVSKYL